MNRDAQRLMNDLQIAWNSVRVHMRKMYQSIDVRPSDPLDIFKFENSGSGEVKFNVGPVIFNMPEKANSRDVSLFIGIAGWLSFTESVSGDRRIKTRSFGTKIGYFRAKKGALEHVYGAHYDLDEVSPGHPVFHGQISSQIEFSDDIVKLFRRNAQAEDRVSPILSNVRIPTAQMDIFSVITQICADHLIHADSGKEVRDAFILLRTACGFFIGAANRMAFLNTEPAISCYRSTHWYSAPPPSAAVIKTPPRSPN